MRRGQGIRLAADDAGSRRCESQGPVVDLPGKEVASVAGCELRVEERGVGPSLQGLTEFPSQGILEFLIYHL